MRLFITSAILAFSFLQISACLGLRPPFWQPVEMPLAAESREQAAVLLKACGDGAYVGMEAARLRKDMAALCKPLEDGGKICVFKALYPEQREYNYADGRTYKGTAQAMIVFNLEVDEHGLVSACRSAVY